MGIQRRFYRVKIPLLVGVRLQGSPDIKTSSLTDLSAGGARFLSDAACKPKDQAELILKLPWRDVPLVLSGKVTRSAKIKNSSVSEVACTFFNLKLSDAEEITKVILTFQREEQLHKLIETGGFEKVA